MFRWMYRHPLWLASTIIVFIGICLVVFAQRFTTLWWVGVALAVAGFVTYQVIDLWRDYRARRFTGWVQRNRDRGQGVVWDYLERGTVRGWIDAETPDRAHAYGQGTELLNNMPVHLAEAKRLVEQHVL